MKLFQKLWRKITRMLTIETCYICKRGSERLCFTCLLSLPKKTELLAPASYILFSYKNNHVKQLLRAAKYSHRGKLYGPLIFFLSQQKEFLHLLQKREEMIILPLPMQKIRVWKRGQDHTDMLGVLLSKELTIKLERNILLKKRYTKRQALLSRKERMYNQKNSFEIAKGKELLLENKTILLIDDIITTGSTLSEAKTVLETTKVKEVICIALAH